MNAIVTFIKLIKIALNIPIKFMNQQLERAKNKKKPIGLILNLIFENSLYFLEFKME